MKNSELLSRFIPCQIQTSRLIGKRTAVSNVVLSNLTVTVEGFAELIQLEINLFLSALNLEPYIKSGDRPNGSGKVSLNLQMRYSITKVEDLNIKVYCTLLLYERICQVEVIYSASTSR
ncbi:hypothetical protein J6590_033528 [Homalodisca vitripennis]|nr:hypothetical protein J6590_033528 [Homalodisca vitripennis]